MKSALRQMIQKENGAVRSLFYPKDKKGEAS
jgi:hypothetical protein